MVSKGCPTREELLAFSLGRVSHGTQSQIWEHLQNCTACLDVLMELEREADSLLSAVTRASLQPASAELLGDRAIYYQGLTRTMALAGRGSSACVTADTEDALIEAHEGCLGQYELLEELGRGGMGVVFRARHTRLEKIVALKILHGARLENPEIVERFQYEIKAVGKLDHPSIVHATDAGQVDGTYYLAMEFVPGANLSRMVREGKCFPPRRTVEVIRDVARGLQHAHRRGLVHRDVKPSNILLDNRGHARITDFGLVLAEHDLTDDLAYAGTPAYMSPEQARGEGHRVDGRSDIFSLGAVFYRLLTDCLPFEGTGVKQLCHQIVHAEPTPPREIDPTLPEELERICLTALAKDLSDRYVTAGELADDLDGWLRRQDELAQSAGSAGAGPLVIIPRGYRPYESSDATFFLSLVPGPRDGSGLPLSIRFWKRRIEESGPDRSFSVGLLSGPVGAGKTSLIAAGVLPCLADHVETVCLVATAEHTEAALASRLTRLAPSNRDDRTLVEIMGDVQLRVEEEPDAKLLLVIDQFEQWLQRNQEGSATALSDALSVCDGRHLSCLLVVRDEFLPAAKNFMNAHGWPAEQNVNWAPVDLLDLDRARKVLAAHGQAWGALPDRAGDQTAEQIQFLDEAVAELAEDGRVSPFRLAMFAEVFKNVFWTRAGLRRIGGGQGAGVAALRSAFSSSSSHRNYCRYYQAARAVLAELCPPSTSHRAEHSCENQRLLEVSGCVNSPREFEELMSILNHRLRLISLVDADEESGENVSGIRQAPRRFYRLSHDYLVPVVREWVSEGCSEDSRRPTRSRSGWRHVVAAIVVIGIGLLLLHLAR